MIPQYELRRSNRKTISIEIAEINSEAKLVVRAPLPMPVSDIEAFLRQKSSWIDRHIKEVDSRIQKREYTELLTQEELDYLGRMAVSYFAAHVPELAGKVGVTYGRVTVRCQKTRWGSCSSRGNLNFNLLLMLAPEDVVDYVIVHELCHRKEMNHSDRFWREVEKVIPDYKARRKWLKENGTGLMNRVP